MPLLRARVASMSEQMIGCAECALNAGCTRPWKNRIGLTECDGYRLEEFGRKNDLGKLRWDLVQPLILQEYVKVLTEGAKKYAPNNWRKVEDARNRYFAALLRHIWAWWLGERDDPEWGLHHLAHAMCCVTFLAEPELEAEASVRVFGCDGGRLDDRGTIGDWARDFFADFCAASPETREPPEGWEFHPVRGFFWSKRYAADVRPMPAANGWLASPWVSEGTVFFGNVRDAMEYCERLAPKEDMVESDHGHHTSNGGVRGTDSSGSEGSGG